jgi:fatty acid desaturase
MIPARDYGMTGADAAAAKASGLASATWYRPEIDRAALKALLEKRDGPALRDTALWWGMLLGSAAGGVWFWGSWACLPFFLVYGVLYGSASDSRWHECGHRTAFKTGWLNSLVFQVACFMIMREPEVTRWSHSRHHADTLVVGRDPEIAVKRPPNLALLLSSFVAGEQTWRAVRAMLRHAAGRLSDDERDFVPHSVWAKVFLTARIWLALHLSSLGLSLALGSWLPVLLVGILPTMYGAWLARLFDLTQHAGLAEDVLDHRLNARSLRMNPVFRFVYWNMNYHLEHHLVPMVPYHALPRLHELLRHELPEPCPGLWAAYREIVPAVLRQVKDPSYALTREIPSPAWGALIVTPAKAGVQPFGK